jgi:Ca2+/Na+ antiporter
MRFAFILIIIGSVLFFLLSNIKLQKKVLKTIGVVFSLALVVYGLILLVQPNEYIQYTKTTISQDENTSKGDKR